MFSTILAIFIALNVISTLIVLAACVVAGQSSRIEMAEEVAVQRNLRVELEYAKPVAASHALVSQA
ncbi:MAG: hypothetical protein R3A44_32910 [Caldilineaceae bacterium]